MDTFSAIAAVIATATGQPFQFSTHQSVGGGCINAAYRLDGDAARYFVKLAPSGRAALEMFSAEAEGLQEIATCEAVRAPRPVCHGEAGGQAYLVLEFLEFGRESAAGAERLGRRLALMHRCAQRRFGWHRDNTIGSTPQPNGWSDDWVGFWRAQRLGFQLQLAARNGHGGTLQRHGEQLMELLPALFTDYRPSASLLHGDLWSGNYGFTTDGEPVIFDPAVYFGDREADLAMTELFGGFPPRFYAAYKEAWPLDPGYSCRKLLYNLYHILNHLNLFGGGYLAQAERMQAHLLSVLR